VGLPHDITNLVRCNRNQSPKVGDIDNLEIRSRGGEGGFSWLERSQPSGNCGADQRYFTLSSNAIGQEGDPPICVDAQVNPKVRLGGCERAIDAADNCRKVEHRWNRIHPDKNLTLCGTGSRGVDTVFVGCRGEGCLVHGKDAIGGEVGNGLGQVDQGCDIVDSVRIRLLRKGLWL
jgi:hypothetical protein